MLAYRGYAYAAAGCTDDARNVVTELVSRSKNEYVSSFGIALIHDVLGGKELALAALERAYQTTRSNSRRCRSTRRSRRYPLIRDTMPSCDGLPFRGDPLRKPA